MQGSNVNKRLGNKKKNQSWKKLKNLNCSTHFLISEKVL